MPLGVDLQALASLEEGVLPLLLEGPVNPAELAAARGGPLFVALAQALSGSAMTAADGNAASEAGAIYAMAQLWRGNWGHAGDRLPLPAMPEIPLAISGLPATLAGLQELAIDDLKRIATGQPLAQAASSGRQWRLAMAVLRR